MDSKVIMDLTSNPNHLSSEMVCNMLRTGQLSKSSVESVFGNGFANSLLMFESESTILDDISKNLIPSQYDEYTQVYVWGETESGKTSVLGSLFASIENECSNVVWKDDEATNNRRKVLTEAFNRKNRAHAPLQDKNTHNVQAYNVEFSTSRGIASRKYQFSFIEVNIDSEDYWETLQAYGITKKANNKIHLLCFDSSKSEFEQRNQSSSLSQIIPALESNGVLNTSVGLYLLVTKTDLMIRVPLEYRYEAAQTLITARHRNLWQLVVNACYKMNIYDATPIPFSIGDTVLKNLLTPDLSRAKVLLQYPILLKSQPCLTFYQRLLRKGNLATTIIISLAAIASIAYGIAKLIDLIPTAPDDEPVIYNFTEDFLKRESSLMANGKKFTSITNNYDRLSQELYVEQSIVDINGNTLNDIDPKCDNTLHQHLFRTVKKEYSSFFKENNWSTSWEKNVLVKYSKILIRHKSVSDKDRLWLKRNCEYISKLSEISQLISKSNRCQSLSDVQYICNNYKSYLDYPYNNDIDLRNDISSAKQNAYRSYASHLLAQAKNAEIRYQVEKSKISLGLMSLFSSSKLTNLRNSFRQSTSSLRRNIEEALRSITPSESYEANQELKKAKNLIDF